LDARWSGEAELPLPRRLAATPTNAIRDSMCRGLVGVSGISLHDPHTSVSGFIVKRGYVRPQGPAPGPPPATAPAQPRCRHPRAAARHPNQTRPSQALALTTGPAPALTLLWSRRLAAGGGAARCGEHRAARNQYKYGDVYALQIGQRTDGGEPGAPGCADLGTATVPPAAGAGSRA